MEKLIATARAEAEEKLFEEIGSRISGELKGRILALLQKSPDQRFSPFQQLQQAAGRPSPDAFDKELDALEKVTAILPEIIDLSDPAPALVERFAASVSGLPTLAVQRIGETKQVALLLCWLWRLRTELIDMALTMGNELIAGVFRRARNAAMEEQKPLLEAVGYLREHNQSKWRNLDDDAPLEFVPAAWKDRGLPRQPRFARAPVILI